MIEVFDNNNRKLKCEVLFTFQKDNKSFVVYKDDEDDVLASYYKIDGDKMIILPILEDNDYDIVDAELEKWWDKNE